MAFLLKPVRIEDGLFVSSMPLTPDDFEWIRASGIQKVVFVDAPEKNFPQLASEQKNLAATHIHFQSIPFGSGQVPLQVMVTRAVYGIQKPCLVHCRTGTESPFVAVAYLMKKGTPYLQALQHVRQRVEESGGHFGLLTPLREQVLLRFSRKPLTAQTEQRPRIKPGAQVRRLRRPGK